MLDKHQRFADEFVLDFNGAQAAVRAGYAKSRAKKTAYELLQQQDIQEYIKQKQAKISEELDITHQRVLKEYARIAFF